MSQNPQGTLQANAYVYNYRVDQTLMWEKPNGDGSVTTYRAVVTAVGQSTFGYTYTVHVPSLGRTHQEHGVPHEQLLRPQYN